jgi:hypothetical protein
MYEDPEVDQDLIKSEKRTKQQHEIHVRVHRTSPEYRQRLQEAGLSDVLESYEQKGIES